MFKVTALCGSMRFTEEMIEVQHDLGKQGYICLLPVFNLKDDGQNINEDLKDQYKLMHFQRIRIADDIHVIVVDDHIGESTQIEIRYAKEHNKPINYIYYRYGERENV